jgi:hypothetical protein
MNERIKQLAEQAITERLSIDEYIEALKKEPYDFYGFRVSELEKFAELIVKECMKICQNHPSIIFKNEWDADVVATDIVSRLESHFGVTE